MKYCKECAELKETDGDTCPDCGAYLPEVKIITPALSFGIAAVLITAWIVLFIITR